MSEKQLPSKKMLREDLQSPQRTREVREAVLQSIFYTLLRTVGFLIGRRRVPPLGCLQFFDDKPPPRAFCLNSITVLLVLILPVR